MANGLCTSCQGLQRTIDKWRKRDEQDRHRADAAEAEVDRLRADAMAKAHRVGELAREVDRLRAEVDALADLIGALDGYRTAHHTGHAEARLDARVVMFRARSALDQEAPT